MRCAVPSDTELVALWWTYSALRRTLTSASSPPPSSLPSLFFHIIHLVKGIYAVRSSLCVHITSLQKKRYAELCDQVASFILVFLAHYLYGLPVVSFSVARTSVLTVGCVRAMCLWKQLRRHVRRDQLELPDSVGELLFLAECRIMY